MPTLIGRSAGAVIALEVAQQLNQMGRNQNRLIPKIPVLIAVDDAPLNTRADISSSNSFLRDALIWFRTEWRKEPFLGKCLDVCARIQLKLSSVECTLPTIQLCQDGAIWNPGTTYTSYAGQREVRYDPL